MGGATGQSNAFTAHTGYVKGFRSSYARPPHSPGKRRFHYCLEHQVKIRAGRLLHEIPGKHDLDAIYEVFLLEVE